MPLKLTIVRGSLLDAEAEAIVNPANSSGRMGGGVAAAIRRAAGTVVEREATAAAPIPVGKAIVTSGGATRFKAIIHSPTMRRPAERVPLEHASAATRAALEAADARGLASLAMPGMGTGVGRVPPASAADAMVRTILGFQPAHLREVILVDVDERLVMEWRLALGRLSKGET